MTKYFLVAFLTISILTSASNVSAQQTDSTAPAKTYHIGVFAPLYLDSVFTTTGTFRYRDALPKFITPAVDFVNGIMIGLDSLETEGAKIEVRIYDTKSYSKSLNFLIKARKLDDLDMMVGPVRDMDYKQLADFALTKHIPFISVSYPNDGGITSNPFVLILNSTLRSHCEAIFSFVLQNHGTDKVVLCRKKGPQEDRVASYIKSMNEQDGKPLINISTINFDSTVSSELLAKKLDSNRNTIVIGGSLDENFAFGLSHACDEIDEKYPITLIGMPNWDGFKSLTRKGEFDDFPIYFTTPYYNAKQDHYSHMLSDAYQRKLKGKPSDMAFKGFECAQYFVKLLTRYPNDFLSHINDNTPRVFTEFNFKPVSAKGSSTVPDYFENKHLYFIRILKGITEKAW